ncbi:MAG: hypothetical protein R6V05_04960 [Candidatus Brocadiia bacterium]
MTKAGAVFSQDTTRLATEEPGGWQLAERNADVPRAREGAPELEMGRPYGFL